MYYIYIYIYIYTRAAAVFTVCPQPWVASLNQEDALPLNISWPLSEHRNLDTSKGHMAAHLKGLVQHRLGWEWLLVGVQRIS